MAHNESMDLDSIDSDFDNKENSFHHNNVLQCTEKGYEELDVSELNMKLRYSITSAVSPMSKSYSVDNRGFDSDDSLNCTPNEGNLTRSYNSTLTKNDNVNKVKSLPLQSLPKDQFLDGSKSASVVRQLDTTAVTADNTNIIITGNDDENLSLPSSSSSAVQTPESTTPIKDMTKDGGSPIMRGLKSVLSMFRPATSPIPPAEGESNTLQTGVNPEDVTLTKDDNDKIAFSTPMSFRNKVGGSIRSSPIKESIVFNDEIEKELQWKDDTTIVFNHEKSPIHKLFLLHGKPSISQEKPLDVDKKLNSTVEYMDVSYNDSQIDKTMMEVSEIKNDGVESDGEFVDCETTFSKTLSPVKDFVDHQDIIVNKDTVISNSNVTMEHLVKQASKVILNITVPANDDSISINEVLESSRKNVLNEEVKSEMSNGSSLNVTFSMENIPGQPITTKNTNDILEGTHFNTTNNITNIIQTQNDSIAVTELSLDSIDINLTEALNIDNAVANKPLGLIKQILVEKSDKTIENIVLQALPDSNPDSLTTNYELDSLEPNVKSVIMNIINDVEVNKNITTIATGADKALLKPDAFEPESMADSNFEPMLCNELVVDTVQEIPANIPLPYDEEFDKSLSLTINNTNIPFQNLTSDVVDCTKLPSVCLESEVVATPNRLILNEDKNLNANTVNLEIDTSLDFVSATNLNQTDLSQILNDIDSILKSDCTPKVTDMKELKAESLLNTENQLKTENHDFTMEICESVMRLETLPDILNHTSTLNLDNSDTPINEVLDHTQLVSLPVVKQQTINKFEIKSEILREQLSMDKKNNTRDDHVDTKIDSIESNEQPCLPVYESTILNDDTKNTKSEVIHSFDELTKFQAISTNVPLIADEEHVIDFYNKPKNNQNEVMTNEYMPHDNKLETEIKHKEYISSQNFNNLIENESDFNIKATADDKVQENDTLDNSNCNSLSEFTCTDIVKQIETNNENINNENIRNSVLTELELDIQNKMFEVGKMEIPLMNTLNENQMDVILQSYEPIRNDLNVNTLQEITVGEKSEEINKIDNETNIISGSIPIEQIINQTEKDFDDQICDKVETNDENVITLSIEVDANNILQNKETCPHIDKSNIEQQAIQLDSENIDEEIVMSEKNSPYVSVEANLDIISEAIPKENLEGLDSTFITKSNIINSPTGSPPIISKGYSFNFDEIDDPFAIKTKIRQSPPPESPNEASKQAVNKSSLRTEINKNRRMSQQERKKAVNKRKFNATFNSTREAKQQLQNVSDITTETEVYKLNVNDDKTEIDTLGPSNKLSSVKISSSIKVVDDNNTLEQVNIGTNTNVPINIEQKSTESLTDIKTSSSEQSTYYSVGTSSNESIKSRNVFNIPEIDDINFNPFATKTKMREFSPHNVESDNQFATKNKIASSPNVSPVGMDTNITINLVDDKTPVDKMDSELMEKESLTNISTGTCSSKVTDDKDSTVREVHTEDDDTEEGPFLEVEDNDDKITNFDNDNVDVARFSDIPPQGHENTETGELFIDAEAFEFLLNQNTTNVVADSGKESLFLKFDPLFAKRISSDGVFAALSKIQKRHSTPSKLSKIKKDNSPIQPSPSQTTQSANTTQDVEVKEMLEINSEDPNITVSKPMMVVSPAVKPVPLPRKSMTPTGSNRRSLIFTSPAMTVIDRLLSMSANNSLLGEEAMTHVSQEQHEADLAITQLRELLAEKEIHVYNLRLEGKELRARLSTMETQMKSLESEGQERLRNINELNERLAEKFKINKSMAAVVEEYERTIASLIAETEQDKKRHVEERMKLINERDEQTTHLASMEASFNDVHMKYERSKQVIMTCKANEEAYKKSLKEFEENLTKMQNNYELLKQHATSKLNHANQEFEKMNRVHEAELSKLKAMIKRKELHITSLEETLSQKSKENEELTAICDELINKVG